MERIRRADPELVVGLCIAAGIGLIAAILANGLTLGTARDAAVHPVAMTIVLGTICVPLVYWAAGQNKILQRIIFGGLLVKAIGTYLRFALTADSADARYYSIAGRQVSLLLADGLVGPNDARIDFRGPGTTNLAYAVGWIYHTAGVSLITAYIVLAFISFVGAIMFYKAATTAIPQLDAPRYAFLLFYMPSMVFWPSSLGKDAWMVGAIGLAAYGASGLTRHRFSPSYVVSLVLGLAMAGWVRPHIAALLAVSLVAASLWPSHGSGNRGRQIVGVVIAFIVLSVALGQVADYFGSERFEVATVLDRAQDQTSEGNSEFDPIRIEGPLDFVPGAVTVLFRPFPFETSTVLQLLSSLEGVGLAALGLIGVRRLRALPRTFQNNGYLRFSVIYILGFVIAFSVISNFGILARQRSQLWPIFMVMLSLKPVNASLPFGSRTTPSPQVESEPASAVDADPALDLWTPTRPKAVQSVD